MAGWQAQDTMKAAVQHPSLYYKGLMTGKTADDIAFTWYQNGAAVDAPMADGKVLQIYFLLVRETGESDSVQVNFISYSTDIDTHTDLTIPWNCAAGEQVGFDSNFPNVASKVGESIGVTIAGDGTCSIEVTARLVPSS